MPNNSRSTPAVLLKTAADQVIWAPLMTVVFFAVLKSLEGHPELIWSTVQVGPFALIPSQRLAVGKLMLLSSSVSQSPVDACLSLPFAAGAVTFADLCSAAACGFSLQIFQTLQTPAVLSAGCVMLASVLFVCCSQCLKMLFSSDSLD